LIPLINNEDIYERLTRVETVQEEHKKLLNSQIEKNESLIEIKTLLARQIEDSKKRDEQMEKFEATLLKVNENLTNLNNNQQQMKQDMNEIGERVSDIERHQEEHKIDPVKLFKGILSYVVTGVGSIIIAYLLWKLGINKN
jgi:chromosome segregation ATPase